MAAVLSKWGLRTRKGPPWSTGYFGGFRNIYLRIPEKRFSVIILSNAGIPRRERPRLAREIAGYFLDEFR